MFGIGDFLLIDQFYHGFSKYENGGQEHKLKEKIEYFCFERIRDGC